MRKKRLAIVLMLLSLTLVAIDQGGSNAPTQPIRSAIRDTFSIDVDLNPATLLGKTNQELRQENAQLKAELDAAKGQLDQAASIQRERDELANLLQFPLENNVPKVTARVINASSSNFESSIDINRGESSGIREGMPVITGAGLVGRVQRTTSNTSSVRLISDTTSDVSVRLAEAGDVGVAAGTGDLKSLRIDLIGLQSPVKIGELVVTSGLNNSVFPPGVPVGRVTSSQSGVQDLRKDVRISPLVRLETVDIVSVIQWPLQPQQSSAQ